MCPSCWSAVCFVRRGLQDCAMGDALTVRAMFPWLRRTAVCPSCWSVVWFVKRDPKECAMDVKLTVRRVPCLPARSFARAQAHGKLSRPILFVVAIVVAVVSYASSCALAGTRCPECQSRR